MLFFGHSTLTFEGHNKELKICEGTIKQNHPFVKYIILVKVGDYTPGKGLLMLILF